jgi:hypothetical protein
MQTLILAVSIIAAAPAGAAPVAWFVGSQTDWGDWQLAGCADVVGVPCTFIPATQAVVISTKFVLQAHLVYGETTTCEADDIAVCKQQCILDLSCRGYMAISSPAGALLLHAGSTNVADGLAYGRCGTAALPCPSDEVVIFEMSPTLLTTVYLTMELHNMRIRHAESGLDQTNGLVVLELNGTTTNVHLSLLPVAPDAYVTVPLFYQEPITQWTPPTVAQASAGFIFVLIASSLHIGTRLVQAFRMKYAEHRRNLHSISVQ